MGDRDTPKQALGDPDSPARSKATEGEEIKVLDSIEAMRLRPEMYIGKDREAGLIQLIEPTVDTLLRQGARHIEITLQAGNIVTITDDGPGLPTEPRSPEETMPVAQYLFTELLAGYGAPALVFCNALSQWLELKICREGYQWGQNYGRGRPQGELHMTCPTEKHGNSIRFLPDPEIFPGMEYDFDKVLRWFQERASEFEQILAEGEPSEWHGKAQHQLASFFRNAHLTIIDERSITSGLDRVRRVALGPSGRL